MRVLVVMNFGADPSTPQRGRWVIDQVEALREGGLDVDLFSFRPGKDQYLPATRRIRRQLRETRYDLVHAHYGLAGWCARLAGADPLVVTFHGTDVRHRIVGRMSRSLTRRIDLVAAASRALFEEEDGRPGLPLPEGRFIQDKAGHRHGEVRIANWRHWVDEFKDLALVPRGQEEQLAGMDWPTGLVISPIEGSPVFVGHHWFNGHPAIESPKLACLDFSAAGGGPLVAYRWDGEATLSNDKLVWVSP